MESGKKILHQSLNVIAVDIYGKKLSLQNSVFPGMLLYYITIDWSFMLHYKESKIIRSNNFFIAIMICIGMSSVEVYNK